MTALPFGTRLVPVRTRSARRAHALQGICATSTRHARRSLVGLGLMLSAIALAGATLVIVELIGAVGQR
jgi:hypothetical protein